MLRTLLIIPLFTLISSYCFAQNKPSIHIGFSKYYATYDFIQKLSDYYPDNACKELFSTSKYNTTKYSDLISRFDTLDIYASYNFNGYQVGQKMPGITIHQIQRLLIESADLNDFKTQAFGIVPSSEIYALANIIETFLPVYNTLIYEPNKLSFESKVKDLSRYIDSVNLSGYFQNGLNFYNTNWDYAIPFNITFIPSIEKNGFTATAFSNQAVSEIQLDFDQYDILFSVLMHEIYHILYDEQDLKYKNEINDWFDQSNSNNSQYALLLMNEVLATAIGNGYVYEDQNGVADSLDWYNMYYINAMAKKLYPTVKKYILADKSIDQNFINSYLSIYDNEFSSWNIELENLMTYRYVISEDQDFFDFIRQLYPYSNYRNSDYELTNNSIEKMMEVPLTKVISINNQHKTQLTMISSNFPELKNWKFNPKKDFIYTTALNDKTKLIIVNAVKQTGQELWLETFIDGKIP